MESFDDVIMGAGLGGLSAAACLSRQGHRVAVLEQHYLPGGCCHSFPIGDYTFCADVHYVSQCRPEQTIGAFLRYIDRDVPFNSLDADCIDRVVTPEADFNIPLGWEALRRRLHATFPEEAAALNLYCDEIQRIHAEIGCLSRDVCWHDQKWSDWLKLPRYMNLFLKRNQTLQDLYDRVGLSPKLQAVLAGQSGDYALPPEEISLFTHAIVAADYAEGAYYPRHHFEHLVGTMVEAITSRGGVVRYSTPVEQIQVGRGQVQGVVAGGVRYHARAYISDLDPKLTVQLMGNGGALSAEERRRLTAYEYSASAFNIYLGLDSSFDPLRYNIGSWNVWYYPSGDLNRAYRDQLAGKLERPWLFLSCPTMKSQEPGMAPEGHHVLEIATVCPYALFNDLRQAGRAAYKARKRAVYEELMTSLRDLIPDVDDHIRVKIYGTPTTSEFYLGQPQGNIYGAKLVPGQVGLNRLGYRTELPNLFLVGASAGYPSVPGVIRNGMDVSGMISGETIRSGRAVARA